MTHLPETKGRATDVDQIRGHNAIDPVTITWRRNGVVVPGWAGDTSVTGSCTSSTTIRATVSNAHGSHSSPTWSSCQTGPWL